MGADSYSPPVSQLLTYGDCSEMDFNNWPDYRELGLGAEQIPELIRMATDEELYQDDVDDLTGWAPVHAWRTLGQLRAEAAIEPLLSVFSQQVGDYWEWINEEVPLIYRMIGPAAIPALKAYLADTSQEEDSRITVLNCLQKIGEHYPEVRDQCIAVITAQLESFAENGIELNSFIVASLADMKAVQSAPVIERAFTAELVDPFLAGDWDEVQVDLGLKSREELPQKKLDFNLRSRLDAFGGAMPSISQPGFSTGKADSKTKAKRKMVKESRKKNRKKRK